MVINRIKVQLKVTVNLPRSGHVVPDCVSFGQPFPLH